MIESTKMKLHPASLFFVTLGYYLLLSAAPDKKLLIALFILSAGIIYRFVKNIPRALLLLYFIQTPIIIGKKWITELVNTTDLAIYGRPYGMSADFTLTLQHVVIIGMAVIMLYEFFVRRTRFPRNDPLLVWLILLPLMVLVATLLGSVYVSASMPHVWYFIEPLIVYVFIRVLKPKVRFIEVLSVFGAMLWLETGISLLQKLLGSSIGLVIEEYAQYIPVDLSADAGIRGIPRFGGTYGYANNLAHIYTFLLPLFFSSVIFSWPVVGTMVRWALLAGVCGLILTQSRSAWLGVGMSVLAFFFIIEKIWRYSSSLQWNTSPFQRVIVLSVLFGSVAVVIPRVSGTLSTFEPLGSGETRIRLVREAMGVIQDRWVSGVGLELDAYYMYTRSRAIYFGSPGRPSVLSYFPEPVHNGFIRLLMQVGIIGVVPYIIVLCGIFRMLFRRLASERSLIERMITLSLILGITSWYLNSMLQPLLPELHLILAVSMIRTHIRSSSHV